MKRLSGVVLLSLTIAGCGGAGADEPPGVLRASRLELVDDAGVVRASIKVEPGGEVVFRLMDPTGTIRVKMGASADGSGLVLENDATEPGIHALATSTGTRLTLRNKDGSEQVLTPHSPPPPPP
jgi:hypothetical protein